MNEHETTSTNPPPAESQPPIQAEPARGGMSPLRMVLLLILALMIAALAWDWGMARPASEKAYQTISVMVEESAARPAEGGQASPADVQKAIGREPTTTKDGGHYIVEEYHWIRGLPFKSYYVIVVYNKREGGTKYTLANVELNQPLEPISEPGAPVVVDPSLTEVEAQPGEVDPAQSEGANDVSPPVEPGDEPAPVEPPAEGDTPAEEPAPDAPAPPPADEPETPAPETPAVPEPAPAETPAEPAPPAEDTPEAPASPDAPPPAETPDAPAAPDAPPAEDAPEPPAAPEPQPAEEAPAEPAAPEAEGEAPVEPEAATE